MKKVFDKISKVFIAMGVSITLFTNRVFALTMEALYGIYEPPESSIYKYLKILALPTIIISFMIGILVYIKKRKSSKDEKVLTIICVGILCISVIIMIVKLMNG